MPELENSLVVVDDDDEPGSGSRDDLLTEQRPAPAFDQIELRIHLVRSINRNVETTSLFEGGERDAERPGESRGLLRGWNADYLKARPAPSPQGPNHELGSGAGAQSNRHPIFDQARGIFRCRALLHVGTHTRTPGGSSVGSAYSIRVDSNAVGRDDAVEPLVLAIDVGTSSARALVYDAQARRVEGLEVHRPYAVLTTPDGGVVIHTDALVDLCAECVDTVMGEIGRGPSIAAVACDTFWHSLLGVDASGKAITPVYTWADTRSSGSATELRTRLDADAVHARTGCVIHSSYLPAKLVWLQATEPDTFRQVAYWMSFGEYLYLRLFGERRVSLSMASATGLFDQRTCSWDQEVVAALPIKVSQLSPLTDFDEPMSGLHDPYASRWPGLASIPWYLPLGDGGCNNVGSGGFCADWVVLMIGTSGAIRVVQESDHIEIPPGVWTYRIDRRRIVQGGALSDGGNVFAWLGHTLQLPAVDELERELVGREPDMHGLTVLPFLAGERSPDWNPNARAIFAGMTLATTPLDMVQATMEAVAYRFGTVYDVLKAVIPRPRGMIGSGAGLIHSPAWLQMMTDVLGEPITVSAVPEASSRGAALLVLETLGALKELGDVPVPLGQEYRPIEAHEEIYRTAMARQQRLYRLFVEGTATEHVAQARQRGESV